MSIDDGLPDDDESSDGVDQSESYDADDEGEIGEPTKKKMNLGGLVLFGLIAAVAGGTYFMCTRAGAPSPFLSPAVASANSTINSFLSGGNQNVQQMMVSLHDTAKVVKQFNNYTAARQVPLDDLKTNPFRTTAGSAAPTEQLSDDAARRFADDQRAAAVAIASGLKLQSVVYGPHSICMINGRPYSAGQGNDDFVVDKILPDSVWIKIGAVRTQIKMVSRDD
jgi:hypothetical protein